MTQSLSLENLVASGVISHGDAHFARFCADSAGPADRGLLEIIVASVSQHLAEGHPCVPLSVLAGMKFYSQKGALLGALPEEAIIRDTLRVASCVAKDNSVAIATTPLVLDEDGRLYVARFFEHECRLARALAVLLETRAVAPENSGGQSGLDRYFAPVSTQSLPDGERDLQREAAALALRLPLCVISGGPGTGKTSTVAKILALLFDEARDRGQRPPVIQLLAPTGKAAARMMEAITTALREWDAPSSLHASVGSATTIHRALGVIPGNENRFRRGREQPLRADVVLVDEASMVDLALMRHLLEALRPTARLILLGDRHQLASVEAGSVLSEISSDFLGKKNPFTIELQRSYRFSDNSGIARLAQKIRAGDGVGSLHILEAGAPDLTFVEGADWETETLRELVVSRYGEALRGPDVAEAFRKLNRFNILCAHRKGPFGTATANETIYQWLASAGAVPAVKGNALKNKQASVGGAAHEQFYRGRLLLVRENDYALGLFNGDIGLVWPAADGRLVVYFESQPGLFRALSPAQLPEHETAYALTIHKSQGSEHDEVALVLPEENSPLLSRELIYTGVTRARKHVYLFGTRDAVLTSAAHSVNRYSGLGAALSREMRAVVANG
jgi:exodeoxyribonuclease V alpha subunit